MKDDTGVGQGGIHSPFLLQRMSLNKASFRSIARLLNELPVLHCDFCFLSTFITATKLKEKKVSKDEQFNGLFSFLASTRSPLFSFANEARTKQSYLDNVTSKALRVHVFITGRSFLGKSDKLHCSIQWRSRKKEKF